MNAISSLSDSITQAITNLASKMRLTNRNTNTQTPTFREAGTPQNSRRTENINGSKNQTSFKGGTNPSTEKPP